ncbi:nose resistant to fluoxetine 6-like [Brachionus plicatilis]|uniref:Nose resistant to fluoxetine 6-like n=1 Tax=Brachionus plicatilis TaxID=10195 RepID=A0A3M7PIA9_BRAPC|nr:nose resistant to fluoxetine 6-like [Brachionus plicatilis]
MKISFLLIVINFYTIFLIDGQSTYFTLNTFISDTLKQITDKNLLTLDQQCNQILKIWQKALEDKTFWAKNVVDSFGSRPSGFVYGNIVWPGEYSQCLDIHVDQWTSKYCYVNEKIQWTNIFIKNDTLRFKYGMCFPTLCKDEDLNKIFQYALRNLDKNVLPFNSSYLLKSRVICRGKVNIDAYTIIAIILTGLISLLVLSGTVIDIYQRTQKQNDKQTLKKNETDSSTAHNEIQLQEGIKAKTKINKLFDILLTFSAYTNTLKIFKIDEKTKSQFYCLHPMRFFAVVVLHQWNHFIGIDDILVDNRFEYLDWKKNFFFTFISNGFFCVDMFFLIRIRNIAKMKIYATRIHLNDENFNCDFIVNTKTKFLN